MGDVNDVHLHPFTNVIVALFLTGSAVICIYHFKKNRKFVISFLY